MIKKILVVFAITLFFQSITVLSQSDYDLAQEFYDEGRYQEAIDVLDEVIAATPDNHGAYTLRGLAHSWIGNLHHSISDYSSALLTVPDNDTQGQYIALNNLITIYLMLGEYDEGLRLIDTWPEDQHNERYYRLYGLSYIGVQNYEMAIDILDEGISNIPDGDSIYFYRGIANLFLNAYDAAYYDFYTDVTLDSPGGFFSNIWLGISGNLAEISDNVNGFEQALIILEEEDDPNLVSRYQGFYAAIQGDFQNSTLQYSSTVSEASLLHNGQLDLIYLEVLQSLPEDYFSESQTISDILDWYRDELSVTIEDIASTDS